MKSKKTCVRHIDSFGRIVIPKELREKSGLVIGASFTLSIEGDTLLLIPTERHCLLCHKKTDTVSANGHTICPTCLSQFPSPK